MKTQDEDVRMFYAFIAWYIQHQIKKYFNNSAKMYVKCLLDAKSDSKSLSRMQALFHVSRTLAFRVIGHNKKTSLKYVHSLAPVHLKLSPKAVMKHKHGVFVKQSYWHIKSNAIGELESTVQQCINAKFSTDDVQTFVNALAAEHIAALKQQFTQLAVLASHTWQYIEGNDLHNIIASEIADELECIETKLKHLRTKMTLMYISHRQ